MPGTYQIHHVHGPAAEPELQLSSSRQVSQQQKAPLFFRSTVAFVWSAKNELSWEV
jgi:hypothetical protein